MGFDKTKTINAAEKYLTQGKIAQAVQEYARIAEQEPNDYAALNTLGDLYARLKKTQEASGCFVRVAEHYREQGFTLKAIAMYKKILRLGVSAPGVARSLAALYEQQGLYVEAREQYLQVADAAARAGQSRESLEALRRIADFDPKNVDIRVRLAEGYAREDMGRESADAYSEAGQLLLARGDAPKALDCYKRAHQINPASHAVLQGLVSASSAVGDAEAAAAVLERAVAARPEDAELRAMLARTYIDAEDATAAERATEALVAADATNFPLLFEVARLYLRRSYVNEAVRVLSRAVEPALAARQESSLLEILSEALARDPEHIEALKLLLRIYTWQRDDERMHVTLERLAEAAQTHNLVEEERRALEHLVRLVPFDQSYHERLESISGAATTAGLGGAREAAKVATAKATTDGAADPLSSADAATLEGASTDTGYQLYEFDPFASAGAVASPPAGAEFEWNSVAVPETAGPSAGVDPSASFADLNETFAGSSNGSRAAAFEVSFDQPAAEQTAFAHSEAAPQEPHATDERAGFASASSAPAPAGPGRTEAMLRQELESVDFYLEQGYADIARETLDMLERQFGANAEIASRRARLGGGGNVVAAPDAGPNGSHAKTAPADAPAEAAIPLDDLGGFDFQLAPEEAAPLAVAAVEATPEAKHAVADATAAAPAPSSEDRVGPRAGALDAGLAAVFDEFREAVEDEQPESHDDDFETHYNLGLAYKEMDLVDDAVEQFQRAAAAVSAGDGTPRYFQSCNMLGHCFMQKGMPRPAALWFKKGLDIPDLSQDECQALRYELALAFEGMGDIDRAIEAFSEVYGFDVSYRGVAGRLRELQSMKAVGSES